MIDLYRCSWSTRDPTPDRGTSAVGCRELHSFGEVERQQVADVSVRCPLWHLGQHMMQIRIGLDVAGPAPQHETVDEGAGLRARTAVMFAADATVLDRALVRKSSETDPAKKNRQAFMV
jgi:hypothetical protein